MKEQLEALRNSALDLIEKTQDLRLLEEARVEYLGRKGKITDILRGLSQVAAEERPALGQAANQIKQVITDAIEAQKGILENALRASRMKSEALDISLPEGYLAKAICMSSTR